ncbi:MAG TPA: bifunctional phosphopantothenoylcysteine decarboxylase/phosphopantothenate--cysteine ligase CoaBC [Polyangia bacterium]|jgi:phosphopantothenoylcysteine decarboxylase/phosphopantothenate--cysteine ligase|nr:bifunctional phosphopantothenoylcysteine decarboxylase/phosphopantothenate--cysteine ligase CoaBC [Polyangia bacterium]
MDAGIDPNETTADTSALAGKRVVLGVTGGIAAYKAAELCRLFVKAGATVRVVMTDAATHFITPLTMQTLSGHPVGRSLFDPVEESQIGHIRLADECDLVVIAPATADAIARLAAGMADDLLAAVVLASRAPVLLAPAMNVNMWESPLTQGNLARLLGPDGAGRFRTVGPDRGPLACGWVGAGRLIEPQQIWTAAAAVFAPRDLVGRRVVVAAGPTQEPVDAVRFLGNRSSGKMGFAIAAVAAARGAEVTLVAGPGTPTTPIGVAQRLDVATTAEMQKALARHALEADVVVMAAAVADFRPAAPAAGKLSRRSAGAAPTLVLAANPDLLAGLVEARGDAHLPFLVGFAAETVNGDVMALAERAAAKLVEKGCEAIVANDVSEPGIGFGADDNAVTVIFADGTQTEIGRASKTTVAERLWTLLVPRLAARPPAKPERAPRKTRTSRIPT